MTRRRLIMHARRTYPKERAFTLLEVLISIALLVLLAATGAVALGGASADAHLRAAAADVITLDRRARLLASSGIDAALVADADVIVLRIISPDPDQASPAAPTAAASWTTPLQLDAATTITLRTPNQALVNAIPFDAAGRSPDYQVLIERGSLRTTLHFTGATGWWEEQR